VSKPPLRVMRLRTPAISQHWNAIGAAALLDRELAERDAARTDNGRLVTGVEVVLRAAEDRRACSCLPRCGHGSSRPEPRQNRQRAALDREQAARDRLRAQADRDALLRLPGAGRDGGADRGAYTRGRRRPSIAATRRR